MRICSSDVDRPDCLTSLTSHTQFCEVDDQGDAGDVETPANGGIGGDSNDGDEEAQFESHALASILSSQHKDTKVKVKKST